MLILDCPEFTEFCEKYGSAVAVDILERLCDLESGQDKTDGIVTITDTHRHDMLNHTHSGYAIHDGQQFDFIVENGDRNGTVVKKWGDDAGIYQPPEPIRWTLVPVDAVYASDEKAKRAWKILNIWRKDKWFKDLVGHYAYDSHFAPGQKTRLYYREKAARRGLQFTDMESAIATAKRYGVNLKD